MVEQRASAAAATNDTPTRTPANRRPVFGAAATARVLSLSRSCLCALSTLGLASLVSPHMHAHTRARRPRRSACPCRKHQSTRRSRSSQSTPTYARSSRAASKSGAGSASARPRRSAPPAASTVPCGPLCSLSLSLSPSSPNPPFPNKHAQQPRGVHQLPHGEPTVPEQGAAAEGAEAAQEEEARDDDGTARHPRHDHQPHGQQHRPEQRDDTPCAGPPRVEGAVGRGGGAGECRRLLVASWAPPCAFVWPKGNKRGCTFLYLRTTIRVVVRKHLRWPWGCDQKLFFYKGVSGCVCDGPGLLCGVLGVAGFRFQ